MNTIDNHYFANINYYKIVFYNKILEINPNILYQKAWFGNKCSIIGANGIINLSVPLLGGRGQKTLFKDVKIAYHQNWQQQHLRAIASCYGNAPYFNHYYPFFQKVYSQKFEMLFDLNFYILENVIKLLKASTTITIINATTLSGEILFSKKNINENPDFDNSNFIYPQVFEDRLGFVPNLSIIDLLMCMGPQAKSLLLKH